MDAKERALAGALSGAGGTLVLSGLHEAWSRLGLVFETTPMQVVDRAEELSLVKVSSPGGGGSLRGWRTSPTGSEPGLPWACCAGRGVSHPKKLPWAARWASW